MEMKRTLLTRACTMLLLSFMAISLAAQTVTVNVTQAGDLWDELEAQGITDFSAIKQLKVTGVMDNTDFQPIKLHMSNLESLDISGTNVTEIPERVFLNKEKLRIVRLPEGITFFNSEAFCYCRQLEYITFGSQSAVSGKIVFPASLRNIGSNVFRDCEKLTYLDFSSCTRLERIDGDAFYNLHYLTEVLFPSQGNLRLEWNCFGIDRTWDEATQQDVYKGLETMTLPKSVTYVSGYCLPRSLKTLYVESTTPPECANEIFNGFLEDNNKSLKIYIPTGSKKAYRNADGWGLFYQNLQEMGIQLNVSGFGSVQQGNRTYTDGDVIFVNTNSSTTLTAVPEVGCELISVKLNGNPVSVATNGTFIIPAETTVGTLEVAYTANPITINNPNGGELYNNIIAMGMKPQTLRTLAVTGKLNSTDWNIIKSTLINLEVIDLSGTTITEVPSEVFKDKKTLKKVILPTSVTVIRETAFQFSSIMTIEGCENVSVIEGGGSGVFEGCSNLKNLPFGNKLEYLSGWHTLAGCSSLQEDIIMPATLRYIGPNAFGGTPVKTLDLRQCENLEVIEYSGDMQLTTLLLPKNGSFRLGGEALRNTKLTDLILPASVNRLDNNVMPSTLERLYVEATTPIDCDQNAFENVNFDNCVLYVPTGSSADYQLATGWVNFLDVREYGFKVTANGMGVIKLGDKTYKNNEFCFPVMGSATTLQIVPNTGYDIGTVKFNGNILEPDTEGFITLDASTISGTFEITFTNRQLQLMIAVEGSGSYTIDGQTYTTATTLSKNGGDIVKMQLQPETGSFVKQVTINGEDVLLKNGGLEFATDALTTDINVAITFTNDASSFAIVSFQQEGFGTVNVGGETFEDGSTLTLVKGKSITLAFEPNGDSNFQSLLVNGTDVTANISGNVYNLNNVSANTTIKTTFYSPNMIAVNNPNGGVLKQQILDMGGNSSTLRALKVIGTMTTKDWNYVMSGLPMLERFDISETDVKTIPESAFREKGNLTTVHLPSTVISIGHLAFWSCGQLVSIDGCENVQEIGSNAFSYCYKLANFPFGNKIRSIEGYAFNDCTSLPETLVMPSSLTTLGWNDVFNGSSIRNYDLSQCTISCDFGYNTFGQCTSLLLPEKGDYRLANQALKDARLTELYLPEALSYLYDEDVLPSVLEKLYVSRSRPIDVGGNNTFRNIDVDHCTLYVPVGAVDAYSEANGWSLFAKIQEYGFKVKTNGCGVVICEGKSYKEGETIFSPQTSALTMQVVPSSGYEIATLKVGGMALDYADDGTFTVPGTITGGVVEVTFTKKQLQMDIALVGNGSYTINGQTYTTAATLPMSGGDIVKMQLQPATGSFVKQVTIDGEDAVLKNGGQELSIADLDANTNIVIAFSDDATSIATISFQQEGFGTVSYGGESFENGSTLTLVKGKNITLTFAPYGDSDFQSLFVNGTDVTGDVVNGQWSMDNVQANTTVKTTFYSPNMITVENPDGGGLKDMVTAMGSNPRTIRALKVIGKMNSKDWNYVKNMTALEEFDISMTDVKVIPDEAFCDRECLTIVHLPSTIITICNSAFRSCHQLTIVDGVDNVREIGSSAFAYCEKLTNFPFGDAIRSIDSDAFVNCSSLPETLVMPASLSTLGWSNVFNGSSILSFDLSQCTLNCGFAYNTFGKCTSLLLPEKGDYQLYDRALNDAELTELRLPAALSYMSGEDILPTTLERLYVSRSEPFGIGGERIFRNIDTNQCTLYVPVGSVNAYSEAEFWSEFTKMKEYGMQVVVGEQGKMRAGSQTLMGKTTFFPKGSTATFEIIPNAGWHTDAVKLDGVDIPFANNMFSLSGDQLSGKLTVDFAVNRFNLKLEIVGNGIVKRGSLEYSGTQTLVVDSLSTLNLTLVPAAGQVVSSIIYNGKESIVQNGGTSYVTPAITADAILTIQFGDVGAEGDMVTYNVTTSEGGSVEYKNTTLLPKTSIQLPKGQDAVFSIKPEQYFIVEVVKLNDKDVTDQLDADGNLTIKDVQEGAEMVVVFRVNAEIAVVMEDAGNLTNMLSTTQKQKVTKLTIKGPMNDQDFYTMRDEMPQLTTIDLWEAETEYVPSGAFCTNADWGGSVGHRALTSIRLPESIRWISDFAFAGCGNLKEVNFTELKNLESISSRAFGWTALNVIDLTQTVLTSVGSEFYKVKNLENIKLPQTLTYLGDAFRESSLTEIDLTECTNLKTLDNTFCESKNLVKVTLPEGLTTITNSAFNGCENLKTVNFPKSLQNIGGWSFYNTKLQKVDLSGLNNLQSIGEYAFHNCQELAEVLFPSSLEQLSHRAFQSCRKLTSLDLSKTQLKAISEATFESCEMLESAKLPKTVETIGSYAFAWNNKLGGVLELGSKFTSMGEYAFNGTQISVIRSEATVPPVLSSNTMSDAWVAAFVPEGCAETYKAAAVWEDKVILDKEVHAEVTVSNEGYLAIDINQQVGISPATITHLKVHGPLGPQDFAIMRSNMTLLYDLDLSDAEVSVIPENAFLDKKVLMNVVLPNSLLRIEQNAFRGCSALKGSLALPDGLRFIGWGAFQGCNSLEEVVLNKNLEVIQGYAFEGCSSLAQEITLPRDFQSLGERAFANCSSLYGTVKFNRDFVMFMGNEGYGSSAGACFENCSKIETVDMSEPDFLDEIPYETFYGCTSLTTVLLPPMLERIDDRAFANCSSLDGIEFPNTLQVINLAAFENCTSLRSINLSDCRDFGTIESYAFSACSSLETAYLPKSLNWIRDYAFADCRKLANLTVEALQPADLGEYVFRHVHTDRCVLSIPTGTFYDYLSAAQWGEFVSMRKNIDVIVGEGANLYFMNNDNEEVNYVKRRASVVGQQGAKVKDGSSLYVQENEKAIFMVNPDENVQIAKVLFNGKDVTNEMVNGTYETPSVTDASSFEVQVNVVGDIHVKELRMLDDDVAVKMGENRQLRFAVYPTNATDKSIEWTSSDESIVTVNRDGIITGVKPGRAEITGKTVDGGLEQKCEIVIMSNNYWIVMDDKVENYVENNITLPLSLHNEGEARDIQFDIYMPEGVNMADWYGDFGIGLSGRSSGHSVSAARTSDGAVRVIVYSMDGYQFQDSDGELLTLPFITGAETGSFDVAIKNIHISGPDNFDFVAPNHTIHFNLKDYPIGDSNGSGDVTVTDVANTVEKILDRWTERFIQKAADANNDGIISVADITATVDIIMQRSNRAASVADQTRRAPQTADKLFVNDFSIGAGQQTTVELKLDNIDNYTAFQCDLRLPEGIDVAKDDAGNMLLSLTGGKTSSHVVSAEYVDGGALRIVAYSMQNAAFKNSEDGIITLTLEADQAIELGVADIQICDARLVKTSDRMEYVAPNTQAQVSITDPTAIRMIAANEFQIGVEGRELVVQSPKSMTTQLISVDGKSRTLKLHEGENRITVEAPGVYVIGGKKYMIK